jgi:hypothetical protein
MQVNQRSLDAVVDLALVCNMYLRLFGVSSVGVCCRSPVSNSHLHGPLPLDSFYLGC